MTAVALRLPPTGWGIGAAVVRHWPVAPGADVRPGDLLVVLEVDHRLKNPTSQDATKLLSDHWEVEPTAIGPDAMRVEVLAAEAGRLVEVLATPGTRVEAEGLLGVLHVGPTTSTGTGTDPGTGTGDGPGSGAGRGLGQEAPAGRPDPAGMLPFRSVAEVIERNEDLDGFL